MTGYQNLDVWKVSMKLVKGVYQLVKTYPKEEMFGLSSQTKRAAVSIPANIAESMGRQYRKDSIRFLFISRGSCYELETLLCIAQMNDIISVMSHNEIDKLLQKTLQVLNGYIKYLEISDLK